MVQTVTHVHPFPYNLRRQSAGLTANVLTADKNELVSCGGEHAKS